MWKDPGEKVYPRLQLPRTDLIQEFVGLHSKRPPSYNRNPHVVHIVYTDTHTKITLPY